MSSNEWAGVVMAIVGLGLTLNVFGMSRGLGELGAWLKSDAPRLNATTPGSTAVALVERGLSTRD